ncbi:hypothetical protein [Halarchaeum nitratireducens]|uniref:Uncharacterized protein n=1 Tax=Halarchaeum nitratireducens TaxID=489913 RepID=A0A830GCL0_9EURY|nr:MULTISPECIES: hypothetical protein [Halarchaeum]MBP2252169.1 hypothetical protein [Halarchaeum solikamskense]GGN17385.1 hypothetical protein GCM10009021_17740 [Halarchaeum nitratireducens]
MSDDESDDLETAVSNFLDGADSVYEDYERGYTDADAALHVLESHLDDLRAAHEDGDT